MGLLDFFKRNSKPSLPLTNNGPTGPTYLEDYTKPIDEWKNIKSHEWCRMLVATSGNSNFNIKYYGALNGKHNGLITATDFAPLLIVAKDILTDQEIVLFDGCKNGYNAIFCDYFTDAQISNRPVTNLYTDEDESNSFEIILSAYYNINFDIEEEDFISHIDQNGFIELPDKSIIEFDKAKRNAFDAFQIIAINKSGKKIIIVSEELS